MVSYQAQSPVLAAVLPSNSPGVHTLWLPVIALQMGLVLKPGPQEPWTPYRIFAAFTEAGVPREAFSLYPGEAEAGAAVLEACDRAMIFGGTATVDATGQSEGAGPRPRLLQDPAGRRRRRSLAGIPRPDGRKHLPQQWPRLHQLLRCVGVAAHGRNRRGPGRTAGPDRSAAARRPKAGLAAFTVPGMGAAVWKQIEQDLQTPGVTHVTEKFGPRLLEQERASYLRPTIIHAPSPEAPAAQKEYMFPFAAVVDARRRKCSSASAHARRHGHYQRRSIPPSRRERDQHRPAQPRPDPHHQAQLAAAPRRESHRFPVPRSSTASRFPPLDRQGIERLADQLPSTRRTPR